MKKFSEFMVEKEVASTEEVKTEEVKVDTAEIKVEETKTEEVKTEEVAEIKVEETKTEEVKVDEAELSALQKEYQNYFQGLLKTAGISSPAELDAAAMKKFFDGVSAGWTKGEGKK